MSKKAISTFAWFVPIAPIALACVIYYGGFQNDSFLYINHFTQSLPDTLWAWLTFLGNGWGVFALAFPLLILAPRLLTAGIFAGAISAIATTILKNVFDLPRPASLLEDGSFHRIGEALLYKAFPSGHTLTAFAIATALYFAISQHIRAYAWLLFVIGTLVGLSRIAVGAHWLTDVLGGAGVGIWCGLLGALLVQRVPDQQLVLNKPWPRLIAIAGIVAIYAHFTQVMDLELNQPLQYASIAILIITLVLFTKAQFSQPRLQ